MGAAAGTVACCATARERLPHWPQSHRRFLCMDPYMYGCVCVCCIVDKMPISFTFDGVARPMMTTTMAVAATVAAAAAAQHDGRKKILKRADTSVDRVILIFISVFGLIEIKLKSI